MTPLAVARRRIMEREGFISVIRATRIFETTKEEIEKLVKEGKVLTKKVDKYVYVSKENLNRYLFGKKKVSIDKAALDKLLLTVQKLEVKVANLERAMDLYQQPLVLTDRELHALYIEAKKLQITKVHHIIDWSEVLCRLTELHFHQLKEYTNDEKCWLPFIELAYLMCFFTRKSKIVNEARKLAFKAYKQIKQSVLIYNFGSQLNQSKTLFNCKKVVNKIKDTDTARRWKYEKENKRDAVARDINADDIIIV
jgi:exonuclease VII small subunit